MLSFLFLYVVQLWNSFVIFCLLSMQFKKTLLYMGSISWCSRWFSRAAWLGLLFWSMYSAQFPFIGVAYLFWFPLFVNALVVLISNLAFSFCRRFLANERKLVKTVLFYKNPWWIVALWRKCDFDSNSKSLSISDWDNSNTLNFFSFKSLISAADFNVRQACSCRCEYSSNTGLINLK